MMGFERFLPHTIFVIFILYIEEHDRQRPAFTQTLFPQTDSITILLTQCLYLLVVSSHTGKSIKTFYRRLSCVSAGSIEKRMNEKYSDIGSKRIVTLAWFDSAQS